MGEYWDEAVSGYRRNRGPGLDDALAHAEDVAAEHGVAELWAQHSDRLARGDGRSARHTVELALWALKRDVRIRTLQDPDTFRDLLYAVVTGERNNEDSRRKGLATQAGRRRAAARGDFIGHLPDGYRLAVDLDANGRVLGAGYHDALAARAAAVDVAQASMRRATMGTATVENIEGYDDLPVSDRKRILGSSVDAVIVDRAHSRIPVEDRVRILWRGEGPEDLPRRGRDNGPIRPYTA